MRQGRPWSRSCLQRTAAAPRCQWAHSGLLRLLCTDQHVRGLWSLSSCLWCKATGPPPLAGSTSLARTARSCSPPICSGRCRPRKAHTHRGRLLLQMCLQRTAAAPRCQWVRSGLQLPSHTPKHSLGWWMMRRSQRDMARQRTLPWGNKSHAHMACTRSPACCFGRTAQGTARRTPSPHQLQASLAGMAHTHSHYLSASGRCRSCPCESSQHHTRGCCSWPWGTSR